jgi:hypothetical protein
MQCNKCECSMEHEFTYLVPWMPICEKCNILYDHNELVHDLIIRIINLYGPTDAELNTPSRELVGRINKMWIAGEL